jgi:hypothetical protein
VITTGLAALFPAVSGTPFAPGAARMVRACSPGPRAAGAGTGALGAAAGAPPALPVATLVGSATAAVLACGIQIQLDEIEMWRVKSDGRERHLLILFESGVNAFELLPQLQLFQLVLLRPARMSYVYIK